LREAALVPAVVGKLEIRERVAGCQLGVHAAHDGSTRAGTSTTGEERPMDIPGIHHLTANCGDPQRNVDFYASVLEPRLGRKTVNFDDPTAHHLLRETKVGTPGSIMTLFAWPGAPAWPGQGRIRCHRVGGPGLAADRAGRTRPRHARRG